MLTSSVYERNTVAPRWTDQSPPLGASYCCMNVLLVSANVNPARVMPAAACHSEPVMDTTHGSCEATKDRRLGSGCCVALGMK